ncbi:MAG: hypothetical protein CMF25_02655 [Kangiellaceae bacterium]|nr:hypothetical protein [Kangiellaceae bacterium]|tara:strand:+ start:7461 stop:7943 length:483 start_codon:yes stop_codon:yes gene_type:complete
MRILFLWALMLLTLMGCSREPELPSPSSAVQLEQGQPLVSSLPLIGLTEVYASPEKFYDQQVILQGRVYRVCKKDGCWVELVDSQQQRAIRVSFYENGFSVPTNTKGYDIKAQGYLVYASGEHQPDSKNSDLHYHNGDYSLELFFIANGVTLELDEPVAF